MNVIISQAMANGLPVAATDHSGLPDQVVDGENGVVAAEGDPGAFAEKLLFLLEHPDLWPEMGLRGRARAKSRYDSQVLIARQLEYYASLIENGSNRA